MIAKWMRYILPTGGINKIDLYMVSIKIYLYLYLIFHLDHFNTLRSVLCLKQLAISQLTTLNKDVII